MPEQLLHPYQHAEHTMTELERVLWLIKRGAGCRMPDWA